MYDVYEGGATEFNNMLANSSSYRTLVVEDSGLSQAQINVNSLNNFVRTGGILIVTGDARIIESGFNMSSATSSSNGAVFDTDVIDAPYGSTVVFSTPNWYFFNATGDSPLHTIVWAPGGAYVCGWDYGAGRIFFATDVNGTVIGKQLADAMDIIGARAQIASGAMSTAFVNSRAVVYSSDINSLGRVVFVVGR